MVGQYIKDSKHINETFNCSYINLSTSKKVDEIGGAGLVKWLRFCVIIFKVLKELVFQRPNLVYFTLTAQGIGFFKDAILVFMAKVLGFKTILHFHNKGVRNRQDFFFDNILYRLVFKNTKVILLAPELFEDIAKYVSSDQVYYCSNGIPEIKEDKIDRRRDGNEVVLLFLSNLIISKGVLVLLDACMILKKHNIKFKCHIVGGEGDLNGEQLQVKITGLGLDKNVIYLGKKYGDDKIEVFNNASIFVLPTFYSNECFPLVLLEAMQFSLPLVSTTEGGIPSIIDDGENGFFVSQRNAMDLAQVLLKLIKDKELRQRLGSQAKSKFINNYTFLGVIIVLYIILYLFGYIYVLLYEIATLRSQ